MHRNVLSNSADSEASVRTDVEIVDGSQWEFHAPICLSKIKLGLCKIAEDGREEYCLLDFCATNPRTVSFIIKGNQLSALVNGRSPLPQHIQTITYDS